MSDGQLKLSIGRMATLACLLEVSAPKPGNVYRGADFEDVTFLDFSVSAVVIGEVFDRANLSIGEAILKAVKATRAAVGTNTNLGIVLLLAPLVAAARLTGNAGQLNRKSVSECLGGLSENDGRTIFEAINHAKPGGMGKAEKYDLNDTKGSIDLMAAMQASADRDAIARQYVNGFCDIFGTGQQLLQTGRELFGDISSAIVFAHVAWMARQSDTLIVRKCGDEVAGKAQALAQKAIDEIPPKPMESCVRLSEEITDNYWARVAELDFWLRSDGHRRNPGTTADLIAATLFVAIYNGILQPPFGAIHES